MAWGVRLQGPVLHKHKQRVEDRGRERRQFLAWLVVQSRGLASREAVPYWWRLQARWASSGDMRKGCFYHSQMVG